MSELVLDTIEEVKEELVLDKNQMVQALEELTILASEAPFKKLYASVRISQFPEPTDLTSDEVSSLSEVLLRNSLVDDSSPKTFYPYVYSVFAPSSGSIKLGVKWNNNDYFLKYNPNSQKMFVLCNNQAGKRIRGKNIHENIPEEDANVVLLLRNILLSKQVEKKIV